MIKGSCSWLFKGKGDDVYLQEVWVCVWGEGGRGAIVCCTSYQVYLQNLSAWQHHAQ